MSTNMELITSVTVGSGGASSVTLPVTGTIPATYTDLKILMSVRSASGGLAYSIFMKVNNLTSSIYSQKSLEGAGSGTPYGFSQSGVNDAVRLSLTNGPTSTSNTFSNSEVHIANYASSNYKSVSVSTVTETNATEIYSDLTAYLVSTTDAITSLTFTAESAAGNFVEGSTFYLYGISNVTSTTKATGGIVSSDGTYNYHMFPFSGTFTPTEAITADVLVVGGGGAGGANIGGGGGAGGLRYFASQSLTATGYTCTVGAGGSGPITTPSYQGTNGGTSQFGALTSAVGGGFGGGANNGSSAGSGASGGGNRGSNGVGSASLGNVGANSTQINLAGGGGGFLTAGTQSTGSQGGNGGNGDGSYASWANATQTGDRGYYAGGGGGSGYSGVGGGPAGLGGLGGGGTGQTNDSDTLVAGKPNTGGGGGGGYGGSGGAVEKANGGSGIIIIRYAI